MGSNFFFGKKREGSLKVLKEFSKLYGYKVSTVGRFKTSGKIISSTLIRSLILEGKIKKASFLLSRPVTVLGTVVKGHRRGRDVGFPTANVDPHHEAIPPSGVYAVRVKIGNRLYKGILNRGLRPTFIKGEKEPTIEVHVFGFRKDIYGKDIEIIFVKKIREEKKFKDIDKLRKRIKEDIKRAKYILR